MKKSISGLFIATALMIIFASACGDRQVKDNAISKEDSMKIKGWDALFGKKNNEKNTGTKGIKKVTSKAYAQACVDRYIALYSDVANNTTAIQGAFEEAVGFANNGPGPSGSNEKLLDWIYKLNPDSSTHILLLFGVYVDPNNAAYGLEQADIDYLNTKIGKLTVFLWPRKQRATPTTGSNSEVTNRFELPYDAPFNLGELIP